MNNQFGNIIPEAKGFGKIKFNEARSFGEGNLNDAKGLGESKFNEVKSFGEDKLNEAKSFGQGTPFSSKADAGSFGGTAALSGTPGSDSPENFF